LIAISADPWPNDVRLSDLEHGSYAKLAAYIMNAIHAGRTEEAKEATAQL
jgi:hypothetical protein